MARILKRQQASGARPLDVPFGSLGQAEIDRQRAEARREGREEGLAEVTELRLQARAGARRQAAAEDNARLAVRIAEKILGRELALGPAAVRDIVARALDELDDAGPVTVLCHADDLALLERERPVLLARCAGLAELRADARVARGGCILETAQGLFDARLERQLAAIERALGEG